MLIMSIFRRLMARLLTLIFFIFALLIQSQNSLSAQISCWEFFWALGHPVAAFKVNYTDKKCDRIFDTINKKRLDNYSNGGKLDAFRHVFYMAAFAQKVNARKLRKLGIAHEKSNYHQYKKSKTENGEIPDSLSSIMDLKNNEVGFTMGEKYKGVSLAELKELVIEEITLGGAVIMLRNKTGEFLDCEQRVVKVSVRKWNLPKCLVSSAYQIRE
jgi:hypothetical protein